MPALIPRDRITEDAFNSEREILYKVLFDMKKDMNDLKKLVAQIMDTGRVGSDIEKEHEGIIKKLYTTGDDLHLDTDHRIVPTDPLQIKQG